MPVCAENLPSIVITQVLSYLDWNEKLNSVRAVTAWKPHLNTPAAWPAIKYSREMEENMYFVKERRTNFLFCIKKYGKFIRDLSISFGYSINPSGVRILNAIAESCSILQRFSILGQEPMHQLYNPQEAMWKRSCAKAVCSVLDSCHELSEVGIFSPFIDWSDAPENNIILVMVEMGFAPKITSLCLISESLIEHEGRLELLKKFTGLKKLTVRREKINNDILLTLVQADLQEITIYQDEELTLSDSQQLGKDFWEEVLKIKPHFKVNLILRYIIVIKDMFVSAMPLVSLVLDDLVNIVTKGVMDHLVANYKTTLESFTYTNSYLENFETGDSRLPAALVSMATECKHLQTVQYGFPLSSLSILLLVKSRRFRKLVIPAVEVSYSFDWAVQENWGSELLDWLCHNYRSEKLLERAVSSVMKQEWKLSHESLILETDFQ